jgi:hypothetical protein
MSTGVSNFFFNNFMSSQEQQLLNNLIVEATNIHGVDCYYVPRNINNKDKIYYTDDQSSYTNAYMVALYLENVDGFQGDGNFMSKFGLEIRDQIVLSIPISSFNAEIGAYTSQPRPNEGDIIFFPFNKKCFQIKFVDKFEMFFMLGKVYTYRITCELFEYSNETFNTGIADIDAIQAKYSTNIIDWSVLDETGAPILTEDSDYIVNQKYDMETIDPTTENKEFQTQSTEFIDFSDADPFAEGEGI